MGIRRIGLACLVSLCMLVGLLSAFGAPAFGARDHVFSGSFATAGSGEGELSNPAGVAVNEANGDVYVVDRGDDRVEYFSSAGSYLGQFNGSGTLPVEGKAAVSGRFSEPESIAIDNDASSPSFGNVYVADTGHEAIDKFSAAGAYLGQLDETTGGSRFGLIVGIAVDPSGALWVSRENSEIDEFNGSSQNEFLSSRNSQIFAGGERGFAVDSHDDLYGKGFFYGIVKLNSAGEVLVQEFDSLLQSPNSSTVPSAVAVDRSNDNVYIGDADGANSIGRFSSSDTLIESFGAEQLGKSSGIAIDASTETVYVADAQTGVVDVFGPEPPSSPKIEEEAVLNVAATSTTLTAKINPHGPRTEYDFEYGLTTAYGQSAPVPSAPVGSGFESVEVSLHLQGLLAQTLYHVRVVAHNELGATTGDDETFTTQSLGGQLSLPDGRAWEMVSPSAKEGASFLPSTGNAVQAAVDGSAITYQASNPLEAAPQGNFEFTRVISRRGPEGWRSLDITRPYREAPQDQVGSSEEYRLFSSDLSHGLLQPHGKFEALSAEATERTPYLRSNFTNTEPGGLCGSACFTPLVSASNVPPGIAFGGKLGEQSEDQIYGPVKFFIATPDLTHVLLESSVPLTAGAAANEQLYEWSGGALQLVGVLPASEGGGPSQEPVSGFQLNGISTDGRRVFWSSGGRLYVRDMVAHETLRIEGGEFQRASSDGSRVFLRSGSDLYAYELEGPRAHDPIDLTADPTPGEAANVQALVGSSEDGAYVYFLAEGKLAPGGVLGGCCNLYVAHDGESGWESPKLVAVLSSVDRSDWQGFSGGGQTSSVSPNGRYLAFMSDNPLTGYDVRDSVSGERDEEVYLYDSHSGKLVCASCNPTGARPSGVEYGRERLVGSEGSFEPSTWIAANLLGWRGQYRSRELSDDGRLFFDSGDALVPQDVNATQDVYEYEPSEVGDCTNSATVFDERSGGCVGLISSGVSPDESAFLDASQTGGDVFFLTTAKLASQDVDAGNDVYDAHECTPQAPCASSLTSPPPCSTGDSCKAAPTPQPPGFGASASQTFSGAANITTPPTTSRTVSGRSLTRAQKLRRALAVCKKVHKHQKRLACERLARKHYGQPAKAKGRTSTQKPSILTGG